MKQKMKKEQEEANLVADKNKIVAPKKKKEKKLDTLELLDAGLAGTKKSKNGKK